MTAATFAQTMLLFSGASNDEDAEDLLDWFREKACTSNDTLQSDSDSGCVSCIVKPVSLLTATATCTAG
jgi:hypothetical protein